MRQLTTTSIAAALLLGLGCKPPPKDQAIDAFKRDVASYFDGLNREALNRKEKLRGELARSLRDPLMDPATGTVYSSFDAFDPEGFIVENYKCQACGTILLLTAPAAEYLCKSCGHSPYVGHAGVNLKVSPCEKCAGTDGRVKAPSETQVAKEAMKLRDGAVVRDSFELTQDNPEKPLVAKVRYVRRLWVWDPRGTVKLSQAAQTKAAVDMTWIPTESGAYDPASPTSKYGVAGFHRLDGTYIGEIEFQWKGGTLTEKSRTAETAVRPWKDLTTVGK